MSRPSSHRLAAFTLTEMLVVLAIIGILVLIALPNFTGVVGQTHAVEAQTALKELHSLQKSYHYIHSKYSNELSAIRFIQNKLESEGGNAKYRITIEEASAGTFVARATSVVDFNNNGTFNVWEINQDQQLVEVTPD